MNLIEKLDHYISESSHFGDPLYDAWPKLRAAVLLLRDDRVIWSESYCDPDEFSQLDEFRRKRLILLDELDKP